ncbi:hypothetical protein [Desulfobacca acetoxidans]|uniref:Glycoside hydrolase family 42 N-terminal domain-containing protein n=1 Tax=Desulfobacca acetoxidans (strain ATCC 700848 / DSM 11109 / ASRB2) TaxID=880072 RepID=F2NHY3_DESAR|nr:hypothetical protein [Desulfobacca acetoxidans]AEB09609.1 hypothetical protein Desac_1769 [Desulfobacca acetoxidans DSM 11109]
MIKWFVWILAAWQLCLPTAVQGAGTCPNLIRNPGFEAVDPASGMPRSWRRQVKATPGASPSQVYLCQVEGQQGKFLALIGGGDRGGRVVTELAGIRPHTDYLLEFLAYRPNFVNGVYLEVEVFGQRRVCNQHFSWRRVQPLWLRINSGACRGRTTLVFDNPHPEVLAFGAPRLRRVRPPVAESNTPFRRPETFPVGIFGATLENLPELKAAGFNAVQSYNSEPGHLRQMAEAVRRFGLKILPNFRCYEPDLSRELGNLPDLLGFYIEDEPEGRSISPESLVNLKQQLRQDSPDVLTAVAMLRPQMVAEYRRGADVFLLDPYPVPSMPLTWMADCIEEAAQHVSRQRLWAVVQAFGGGRYVKDGWARRPTYMEMRVLTYLALVHGAHGVFYFSYPEARSSPEAWTGLTRIVGQLRDLQAWLAVPNTRSPFTLEMLPPYQTDYRGRPAVHYAWKKKNGDRLLILVNVLDQPVSFRLAGFPPQVAWLQDFWLPIKTVTLQGDIRENLGPYEVRVYRYQQST